MKKTKTIKAVVIPQNTLLFVTGIVLGMSAVIFGFMVYISVQISNINIVDVPYNNITVAQNPPPSGLPKNLEEVVIIKE